MPHQQAKVAQDAKILVKLIRRELNSKPHTNLQDVKAIPNQSVFGSYSFFPAKVQP